MTTGLPDWADDSMALDDTPQAGPYTTAPTGGLPGTQDVTVSQGSQGAPLLQMSDLGEAVQADAPAPTASGCTRVDSALPESTRGPIERADDLLSNSPAAGDRRYGTV